MTHRLVTAIHDSPLCPVCQRACSRLAACSSAFWSARSVFARRSGEKANSRTRRFLLTSSAACSTERSPSVGAPDAPRVRRARSRGRQSADARNPTSAKTSPRSRTRRTRKFRPVSTTSAFPKACSSKRLDVIVRAPCCRRSAKADSASVSSGDSAKNPLIGRAPDAYLHRQAGNPGSEGTQVHVQKSCPRGPGLRVLRGLHRPHV